VKLVYVHGALVWAGLLTFSIGGVSGLLALVFRRKVWYEATLAAALAALVVWIAVVGSSMILTRVTRGQFVAWNEPRVRATTLILAAALVLALVGRLVDQPSFSASTGLVMGVLPWILVRRADAIRHPVDAIAGSTSQAIQVYYVLILVTVSGLTLTLFAWLWAQRVAHVQE
jgi:hypothetical protein